MNLSFGGSSVTLYFIYVYFSATCVIFNSASVKYFSAMVLVITWWKNLIGAITFIFLQNKVLSDEMEEVSKHPE